MVGRRAKQRGRRVAGLDVAVRFGNNTAMTEGKQRITRCVRCVGDQAMKLAW